MIQYNQHLYESARIWITSAFIWVPFFLTPCNFFLQIEPIVTLTLLKTFFHVIQLNDENIKWFLGYTQKCMKKQQKIVIAENALTQKLFVIFSSKFYKRKLKRVFVSLQLFLRNKLWKSVMTELHRAGSVRAGSSRILIIWS